MQNQTLDKIDRKRLAGVAILIFFLFSLLIVQFYRIQIVEGDKWSKVARNQHYFIVTEPFLRGTFYSNASIKQGHPETPQRLVIDIPKFHLFIDPESFSDEDKRIAAGKLILMLDVPAAEQERFRKHFFRKSRNRKLAMWLDRERRDQILNWWHPYARQREIPRNALYFVGDYQRSYPFGKLLGQVLNTVQAIKDESTHQAIPTGGLELSCNKFLKGQQGKRRLMRSPRNSLETGEVIISPENGADIYLTINHCLQEIAEEELEKGVKKCKAKAGWAAMMDPKTGEMLALAQYPFFYPRDYQSFFSNPSLVEHTRVKALMDANEPGSVMKPITLAIALKANKVLQLRGEKAIFNPEEKMATSNGHFPGRKNLKDTHLHYYLNMNMALQKSSNIYMARLIDQVVNRLGNEWYKEQLHHIFGFGEPTRVELPSENSGLVPTPGKKHPNGALEWSQPTPFSLAMGHNIQTNAIQLARAFAIFANGGYLVKPTIIRKIVKTAADGTPTILVDNTSLERISSFPRVLDDDIIHPVINAMKYATKRGGSAPKADVWGYTEAGKTGTGQKVVDGTYSQTLYCSTFVGFTPVKDSAFVLVVSMDEPEYGFIPGIGKNHMGGNCAGPVFREISKRALEYLGIAPDDPHGYPVGDPRYDPEKADWAKETHKLQELYEKWNKQ